MHNFKTSDIILNPVLGARILWPAIFEFQESRENIPLPLALLVLPIVLHERSRKFIFKMHKKGGSISKAINKKPEGNLITGNDLALGLQERLNYTAPLTLSSLNIGISSDLFSVAFEEKDSFPKYSTNLTKIPHDIDSNTGDDTNEKMLASARLGAWFANSNIETIYSSLKITV